MVPKIFAYYSIAICTLVTFSAEAVELKTSGNQVYPSILGLYKSWPLSEPEISEFVEAIKAQCLEPRNQLIKSKPVHHFQKHICAIPELYYEYKIRLAKLNSDNFVLAPNKWSASDLFAGNFQDPIFSTHSEFTGDLVAELILADIGLKRALAALSDLSQRQLQLASNLVPHRMFRFARLHSTFAGSSPSLQLLAFANNMNCSDQPFYCWRAQIFFSELVSQNYSIRVGPFLDALLKDIEQPSSQNSPEENLLRQQMRTFKSLLAIMNQYQNPNDILKCLNDQAIDSCKVLSTLKALLQGSHGKNSFLNRTSIAGSYAFLSKLLRIREELRITDERLISASQLLPHSFLDGSINPFTEQQINQITSEIASEWKQLDLEIKTNFKIITKDLQ